MIRKKRPILVAAAAAILAGGCRSDPPPAAASPAVTVAQPTRESVTSYLEFTGNTAASDSVTLVARVEGFLESVDFADGAIVQQGDVLFRIQRDQYAAQLQQARAELAAQRAALGHARTELARYTGLVQEDSAPQTEVDRWRYEADSAAAAVLGAEAQVALAELNLSYTTVKAPFAGRVGRHLVDPGNLVGGVGQPANLAEIDKTDPLYVYFTIDERDLLRIRRRREGDPHRPLADAAIPAAFGLLDEEGYPHQGHLDFASLSVAPTTGTLQVRGIFPNPDASVLPGLFVRVRVAAGAPKESLLVPGDALSFDQQGEYLLVVNDADVVERRPVETGTQLGSRFVVEEGLAASDWVVVDGIPRAVPGRKVAPDRTSVGAGAAVAEAKPAAPPPPARPGGQR
jgi:RND family efflux transporter MFP subunit